MKVRLLNPETVRDLYKNHGVFACKCYDTPEKFAEKVGKSCQQDGHMSGSRCEFIKFEITDVDRGTAEQCLRHEIGVRVPYELQDNYSFADYMDMVEDVSPTDIVKNMASFRYIDKTGFEWATPTLIKLNQAANERYDALMRHINEERRAIKQLLEENGVPPKDATEAVNYTLPRATTSGFVIGFTPEALIRFMHKRLCNRAQEHVHEMALRMKHEVLQVSKTFGYELKAHCAHLMWCPEGKRSCGMYPTKQQLTDILKEHKEHMEARKYDHE